LRYCSNETVSGRVRHRFYIPADLRSTQEIELPERVSQQISRVLRLRSGDQISLFDGRGNEAIAVVETVSRKSVVATIPHEPWTGITPGAPEIQIGMSLIKADGFDMVVQKSTELGVSAITAIEASRSVVSLPADRARSRIDRWRRIAIEALEQCERADSVDINGPMPFEQALREVSASTKLIAAERADALPLADQLPTGTDSVYVLIGPEGGFSEPELELAERFGFSRVTLGPTILRSETAAIATVAICRSAMSRPSIQNFPNEVNG
jgi:16S rRNA (uracil1498-N3)-methyltransferase